MRRRTAKSPRFVGPSSGEMVTEGIVARTERRGHPCSRQRLGSLIGLTPGSCGGKAVLLRMSRLFLRTLREDPADAEVPSHKLLVRAGYIRRAAPGIYSWLPLGYMTYRNVENVVREEMDRAGSQEVHFPAL